MSSNLVIVALPADDDPIWKVSSEKKPHLTLCFLGDAESNPNVERIVEFVDHAVTVCEHGSFYMDIDYRDTLGPDEADVFFFRKDGWAKWITQFRNQLLKNNDIRAAYESTQQYPEWTPHLTLGYPTTPAHDDKMPEYGIRTISFDRIAVWTGDFDGPEFRLEWPEREAGGLAVAYSSMNQERAKMGLAAIEHVGVKGMRWGQRKTEAVTVNGKSKLVTPKKAGKLDKKFEKNVASASTWIKVHNGAADHVNSKIGEFNTQFEKKHPKEFADGTLLNHYHPVTKEYHTAYNKMFIEGLNKSASALGTNASGTRKVKVMTENEDSITEFGWDIHTTKVAHAANDAVENDTIVFIATRDANGVITSVRPKEAALVQTESFVDDYLAHYGVKGMRWGSRKSSEVTPTSVQVTTTPHNRKATKVEAKGGGGHDAHPDAVKVAEARQKMRKSGTAALSNTELKEVARRLQLESDVSRLEGERKSGSTFVGKLLRKHGSQQLDRGINRAAGQVTDEAATRAGRAATKKIFQAGVAATL